jgi:membrane protease YdiL (CAAX protease family)
VGRSGKLAGWLVFIGIFSALNYAGNFLSDAEPDRSAVYEWSTPVLGVIQYSILLAVTAWIAAGAPPREMFALYRPTSWGRAAGLAAGTFVAALVLAAALEPLLPAGDEQGLTPEGWNPDKAAQFVASFVLIAGFVPVAEELIFRGLGMTLLMARLGPNLAIGANGLLFALAHGLVYGLPVLTLFGSALALIRVRTGSVFPCMVTHALFNAFAMIVSVTVE